MCFRNPQNLGVKSVNIMKSYLYKCIQRIKGRMEFLLENSKRKALTKVLLVVS